LAQLLRHGQLHAREQVAAPRALQPGGTLALYAQHRAVDRAGLHLDRDRPIRGRHLGLGAERGVGERDADLDDQIVAAARVDLRRRDPRDHVEVARLRAAVTGLALAAQADPRAVLDSRGNLHGVALRPPLAPRAVAARARILDHRAVAAAARTRRRQPEEPLALDFDAAPVALGADGRRRPRLRAGAAALAARGVDLHRDLRLD